MEEEEDAVQVEEYKDEEEEEEEEVENNSKNTVYKSVLTTDVQVRCRWLVASRAGHIARILSLGIAAGSGYIQCHIGGVTVNIKCPGNYK